ncbi:MAG: BolA family transcriptional regulator [Bdellovibrionaceae bacterium]|nr:BolA family transcriptional regulator [Pseudobdellovibrionaceae bacterium]MDW8190028.1 BolA family protein [Pseudobdellovibrionaceae bacterium]
MNSELIKEKILGLLPEALVEIKDLTGTQNHWEVSIISSQFEGLPRIQRHKLILDLFSDELKTGIIHALSLKLSAPSEARKSMVPNN